jgi:hypothetical protein
MSLVYNLEAEKISLATVNRYYYIAHGENNSQQD